MEEATRESFMEICRKYERLTNDNKQVILMYVNPILLEAVERVRRKG